MITSNQRDGVVMSDMASKLVAYAAMFSDEALDIFEADCRKYYTQAQTDAERDLWTVMQDYIKECRG